MGRRGEGGHWEREKACGRKRGFREVEEYGEGREAWEKRRGIGKEEGNGESKEEREETEKIEGYWEERREIRKVWLGNELA